MGAKFSGGGATVFHDRTDTPGEITRELVNASDGAGLHFNGTDGTIDIASPPDLGTKFSFEFIVQADSIPASAYAYLTDFGNGGRFSVASINGSLAIYDNGAGFLHTFVGATFLDDLKVHHVVVTVDGTSAVAYDNGNQVGTVAINSPDIDSCTDAKIGSRHDSGSYFNGTIYRARFWNKTLSQTDVTSVYESASIDYADQWGSQTIVIPGDFTGNLDGWDASNTWNSQTNPSNNMVLAANATAQRCRTSTQLTLGKRYRCTYTATSTAGAPAFAYHNSGTEYALTATVGSSTITNGTANSFEFVMPAAISTKYFYILATTASDGVTLDDVSVVEVGAVADFDLAYANPTQSTIVQNRNDTVSMDGTAAGGVTQISPIEGLNSKALSVGTVASSPADGSIVASGLVGVADSTYSASLYANYTGGIAGVNINAASNGFAIWDNTVERFKIDSAGVVSTSTTNTVALQINSTHANGSYQTWENAGTDAFYLGNRKAISAGQATYGEGTDLYATSGRGISFHTNGTAAPRLDISSAGLTTVTAITETNGVLRSNLLSNSGFDVWSNSTLENIGNELTTTFTNQNFNTVPGSSAWNGAFVNSAASWGVGQQAVSLTAGNYTKLSFDASSVSGVAVTFGTASNTGGSNLVGVTVTAGSGNSYVFEASATTTYIMLHTSSADAAGFTLANVSLKEATPACIAGAGTEAFDGWWKTDAGLSIYRQHNDGGTLTHDGSFYALKTTTTGTTKTVAWPNTTVRSLPEHYQRFNGRKVTFGCWAKTTTANHIRLQIDDGGTPLSGDYVSNDGNWHWLELTDTIDAAGSMAWFKIQFDATSADAYISQPMLVFGSAIGSGNYSRPSGEIIWCENEVASNLLNSTTGHSDVDWTALNVEADSNGKIPKGAKAVAMQIRLNDSASSSGGEANVQLGAYTDGNNRQWAADILGIADDKAQRRNGWIPCNSTGDPDYNISASGSGTLDIPLAHYYGVELR